MSENFKFDFANADLGQSVVIGPSRAGMSNTNQTPEFQLAAVPLARSGELSANDLE